MSVASHLRRRFGGLNEHMVTMILWHEHNGHRRYVSDLLNMIVKTIENAIFDDVCDALEDFEDRVSAMYSDLAGSEIAHCHPYLEPDE